MKSASLGIAPNDKVPLGIRSDHEEREGDLVPRLAKSDELPLQATYHDSDVHDGCHSIFDKFIGADVNEDRGTQAPGTISPA
jgi:hypothetical protein